MQRRQALKWLTASFAAPLLGSAALACGRTGGGEASAEARRSTSSRLDSIDKRMPVLFVAHGAPPLLDDAAWMQELASWAAALPRPEAVLMISAHWEDRPTTIGAVRPVPLVYDFYGFPQRYYEITYASPGAPMLASRVRELLAEKGMTSADAPERGLDHGAFVPLLAMYPKADVPVLQISMPGLDPKTLLAFGRALAPLADEGVLVVGSGFLTHNLREGMRGPTPSWAREFDTWAAETIARRDVDALADFANRAPAARRAHPRTEHYAPILVAAAAAERRSRTPTFPIHGFWNDTSFTRRSVEFG